MARLSALLGILLLTLPASAKIVRYTESESASDTIVLGYPVPLPRASSSAFDGFRDYPSLINRLTALSFASAEFVHVSLGQSLGEKEIHGFVWGRQELGSTPAMLQVGGVHAREWAAPEAVTYIAERLVAGLEDNGLERYLADHLSVVLAPVMNPDGFVATQQAPERTRIGEDPDNSASDPQYPRDGRQRRKNLRDADGQLDTDTDTLLGVDLNRNIGPFWNTPRGSSAAPHSIVYHGAERASEPETRALIQAASLIGAEQLRLFIDSHSFSRVHFYNDTGNARLRTLTRELGEAMGRVPPQDYVAVQEPSQSGVGANDEYFAYTFEVPSYTLELEPDFEMQGAEYGGRPNVSHSGFILPEAEIARVREDAWMMALFAYYHQAGPPILQQVSVRERDSNELVYARAWEERDGGRHQISIRQAALQPGLAYSLELVFNKPMRWAGGDAAATQYPGQNITLTPALELMGQDGQRQELGSDGQWQTGRYRLDTYVLAFSPAPRLGTAAQLSVDVRDLSAHALDADPATAAAWADGHWTGYENGEGAAGDAGGTDQQFCLPLGEAEGCGDSPPAQTPATGGGSGSPSLWLLLALGLYRRRIMN